MRQVAVACAVDGIGIDAIHRGTIDTPLDKRARPG